MARFSRTLGKENSQCLYIKVNKILGIMYILWLVAQVGGENSHTALVPGQSQSIAGIPLAIPSAKPLLGTILDFSPNCTAVTHIFERRGIPSAEIPQKPSNEMSLRYCESPSVGTCCTYGMETKMAMASRLHLEKNSREEINKLSSVLGAKAHKFNDVFNQLLAESKREFHSMFKRTYGVIYEQNAYVFSDLFTELEKYYSRGKVDLGEAMDAFFNTLYQKMFTVLNAQYAFDDKYLGCVSEHMKELKPFGDVPDKLSVQIKRSFVATRTYVQALMIAADVTKKMINIRLNADCTAALTKMQHCGACKGYVEKPCTNYCVNVIKGCLHYLHELDMEWDNFVSSMEKVSERLLGSFNIVMVVEPINIKISEAIMNFQESGQDISNQVFQGCGRPSLGRKKRTINPKFFEPNNKPITIDNTEHDFLDIDAKLDNEIILKETVLQRLSKRAVEPADEIPSSDQEHNSQPPEKNSNNSGTGGSGKKNRKKQNRKNEDNDYVTREPELDKLIKEVRQKVKDSKKFWSNLPYQICNSDNITASADADNTCWNGHTVDRYMHSVTTEHGSSNPEFPGNPTSPRQQSVAGAQIYYLKIAISHLRNAYNGQDVDWSDQEESYYGSGSGSGGGIDDEDDDEGSGLGPDSYPNFHKTPTTNGNTEHPSVRVNKIDNSDDEDDDNNDGSIVDHTSGPRHNGDADDDANSRNAHKNDDATNDNHLHINEPKINSATRLKNINSLPWSMLTFLLPLYIVIWFSESEYHLDML